MNTLLVQLVALCNGFLLMLPAGWCSAPAAPAPVRTGCCHATADDESSSREAPGDPVAECCCSPDATLPQKAAQPDDSVSAPLPFFTDLDAEVGSTTAGTVERSVPLDDGPRLHVLQCVWLC